MIITMSWDDGHPSDLKLMNLLLKYNIKSTFYVPLKNNENVVMNKIQMKELGSLFDIGGHTFNHLYLDKLTYDQSKLEINSCKLELEEIFQMKINSFCFPGGKYKYEDTNLVKEAGFSFARSTRLFNTSKPFDDFIMNTSYQIYNHSFITLLINLSKQGKFSNFFLKSTSLNNLILKDITTYSSSSDACLHLWGHSWEIEKYNLWYQLEEILKLIVDSGDHIYLDNYETFKYYNP